MTSASGIAARGVSDSRGGRWSSGHVVPGGGAAAAGGVERGRGSSRVRPERLDTR